MLTATEWSPASWRSKRATQQPVYPSGSDLQAVLEQLARLPPLVTSWETQALKQQLADCALGRRFLLQGGDCAEDFDACDAATITSQLKILLQMSLVLIQGAGCPVVRIGRIAGQYAKPRSDDMESRGDVSLPSYRGDIINRPEFTQAGRTPDPQLLLRGYERAALTLNFIRSLVKGGFADLHHPEYWEFDFASHSPRAGDYHRIARSVGDALRFLENIIGIRASELNWVDFFTSHEGLHLAYEEAQTRRVPRTPGWFNLSTHLPWIGMRTADPEGAHVEYFRGIANPIAVKAGPATTPENLRRLLDILHPADEPGRLTLIHRFGAGKVEQCLPPLIAAARAAGKTVLWCCDPMHGNTRTTGDGIKTRTFADILEELELSFDVHAGEGSRLSGVHLELTGDDVTECTGGARGLSDADLTRAYRSKVDPRLNYEQAIEIAMRIAGKMSRRSPAGENL
ncbi:MAG: class II 3-deoxy-7-phosphoheptulonate synthase [Bryobacteraceae bacterium]